MLAVFLVAVAAIGFAIWFVFFRGVIPLPGVPAPNANVPGGLPLANVAVPGVAVPGVNAPVPGEAVGLPPASEVASGGLTATRTLIPTVAQDPQLAKDGRSLYYYDRATGQFFTVDPDSGTSKPLSDKAFPGMQNANWDPTGNPRAILEFPDQSKIFFDFDSQVQVTLPSHWQEFEWSPAGTEIVTKSIGTSENNRFLVLADPDGSNARPVAALGRNADKVDLAYSPNNDMIAFSRTGQARPLGEQEIIPIGKNQENFRSFVAQGIGLKSQWSPDGSRILYSAANDSSDWKPVLWTISGRGDGIGSDRKLIGLVTWADKCGFASPSVAFCAAPRDLPTGAGLSRAVANDVPDDLFRVDLATGQYRLVASPTSPAAISKVVVAKDGSFLYYTELVSGALQKIRLR